MAVADTVSCIAFDGHRQIAAGTLAEVALAAKQAIDAGVAGPLLVFDELSSLPVELDLRGTADDVLARLPVSTPEEDTAPRGPGRPKLGVIAREVTLLPRHWDWLASQPGGASATLRRLVEEARRTHREHDAARLTGEAVDRFMSAMTGNLPGHEEASRAFWRKERERFIQLTDAWPGDVREHVRRLATRAWQAAGAGD
ncbi:DUF2239 family protein [Dyella japonica]|uniref:DUF2239 domain-containing protein n=1 Tax=Dyella japonica A8 TaxID=1217721 RepID=A0A075JXV1_9GAMM|nr:DUF2239 family protein [Dyella japonica]AIF46425.1 hypothetical protein HY57_03700 [Dyella japonica A8]